LALGRVARIEPPIIRASPAAVCIAEGSSGHVLRRRRNCCRDARGDGRIQGILSMARDVGPFNVPYLLRKLRWGQL
jgi:hypothetical protein